MVDERNQSKVLSSLFIQFHGCFHVVRVPDPWPDPSEMMNGQWSLGQMVATASGLAGFNLGLARSVPSPVFCCEIGAVEPEVLCCGGEIRFSAKYTRGVLL